VSGAPAGCGWFCLLEGRAERRVPAAVVGAASTIGRIQMKSRPYITLAVVLTVNFFIMWALTYVGVAAVDHIFLNVNRFYMAVVMVAPMAVVMLTAMSHMFDNKRLNIAIYVAAVVVFVGAFAAIRAQVFVGDAQLSRSMIPHHSIAIKNCEQATLDDQETVELCDEIVQTQREEIAQMRAILERLE
jgi:hypothetical protein